MTRRDWKWSFEWGQWAIGVTFLTKGWGWIYLGPWMLTWSTLRVSE